MFCLSNIASHMLPGVRDVCCASLTASESVTAVIHSGPHRCRLQVCGEPMSTQSLIPNIPGR